MDSDNDRMIHIGAFARRTQRIVNAALIFLICILLCLFDVTIPASAEESNNQTVTVGIFEFDGYHMQDDDGNLYGYGIELLKLIERYSHINFKMIGYDKSWSDMLEMLNDGEIDMVTSARRTPERESKYAFSLPVGTNRTLLSTSINRKDIISGNYPTYNDMVIGVVADSSQNEKLAPFAADKGFTYSVVEFEDTHELSEALQSGEIDAILSSDLRRNQDEKVLDTLDVRDFYAIVRKDDTELINELDYAIGQIDLHEGDWQNILYYQFYGSDYSSLLDFTEREKAYIEAVRSGKKTITATASIDRRPYSYVEDGRLTGILIDYFAAIMEVAELPYEIVIPDDSEEYLKLVEENGVDVVIDAMIVEEDSGYQDDGFNGFTTDPYMETGFAVITNYDSIGAIDVIAVDNAQAASLVQRNSSNDLKIIQYDTTEDAMQAVIDGNADAAYVYSYSAQLLLNKDKTQSLHFGTVHDLGTEFAMYIRDSTSHELVTIIDKCIQMVPKSKLDQLISEYTSYSLEDLTVEEFARANPAIAWIAGLIAAIIMLILMILWTRNRWNKKLLHAEEDSNKELGKQLAIVDALSRDYTNVFSIDADRGTAKVIKLEGYVTEGLVDDSEIEYDYVETLSRYISDRVHPDDRASLSKALHLTNVLHRLENSKDFIGAYRIIDDGEEHNYQYVYTYLEEAGHEGFILAGFRNIDETIRDEQEKKKLLSIALAQAQSANKAKTNFLNSMSHDIRTPMNAIIGFTSLASESLDDPDKMQDYLDKIKTSSNHLLSLINDVLDMSRIESGKVQIEKKEVNLPVLIDDISTIVQNDINTKDLDFYLEPMKLRDDNVICDRLRLNQILLNVLSNAMKYTEPGGKISLSVMQRTSVHDDHADYEFRIKDDGIGMSPEFLERVFEPFERENTATVSGIQGTGLGLAITKNLVDLMNGTISVTSEENVGTEFVIVFPFRIPEVEADEADVQDNDVREESKSDDIDFKGKRILLVEDNELNCEIALAILEKAGFEVDVANDGTVAVQIMEETPSDTYDLILSDVQMPKMNGYELTRYIRNMKERQKANIPIVAMTANAFDEDREEALAAGMTSYVFKPINVKKLMETLREVLATSNAD